MTKQLSWDDTEKIGILLSKKHPDLYPLALGLSDIHRYASALGEFKENPADFNERRLEEIRLAWNAELLDRTQ
jgi:FeS assembly protein IscX